ncbi:MAG: 16S rRNA (cytidine(1402)-2'-O)-methyltransferase [Culicoidibacterales bacterium]
MYVQKTVKAMENGGLYLVPTPIGNLGDMTYRAVEVLKQADYILAEDTRVTSKLLRAFDIQKTVKSCHEHNQYERIAQIITDISAGLTIALVSDAGMPCISDPGSIIVEALIVNNLPFTALPGASASVTLYAMSGMSTQGAFYFHGFLPTNRNDKIALLERYATTMEAPVIFYESPHRIVKTLILISEIYSEESKVCIIRELTKLHETAIWIKVKELKELDIAELSTWKGEIALSVSSVLKKPDVVEPEVYCQMIAQLVAEGIHPKQAIKQVALEVGINKNTVYKSWQEYREATL